MSKKKIYRREFLNRDKGIAVVEFDADSIAISDCRRTITLDFWDPDTAEEADLLEYKADMLCDIMQDFRKQMRKKLRRLRKENEWT